MQKQVSDAQNEAQASDSPSPNAGEKKEQSATEEAKNQPKTTQEAEDADKPEQENQKQENDANASEESEADDFFEQNSEQCLKTSPDSECLTKNIQKKTDHLLEVFASLYEPIRQICAQSESICVQILDGLDRYENLRPKSKRAEFLPVMKDTVEQVANGVKSVALDLLEIVGEDNVQALDDAIWDEVLVLEEEFKRKIETFGSKDEVIRTVRDKTTAILKTVVVEFYLETYLGNQVATEKAKVREKLDGKLDVEENPQTKSNQNGQATGSPMAGSGVNGDSGEPKGNDTQLVQLDLGDINLMEIIKTLKKLQ